MNEINKTFLSLYRSALQEEPAEIDRSVLAGMLSLAESHCIYPMLFDVIYGALNDTEKEEAFFKKGKRKAEKLTCGQARMTAEFLQVYRFLAKRDLHPIVMKGIICRDLYPNPEQRSSSDEDLLIPKEQFSLYHKALLEYGLHLAYENIDIEKEYEIAYCNDRVYIELHKQPFPPEAKAYGDLNRFFENVEEKKITKTIYGVEVSSMDHSDHLFYQICHAYKHFLNCGIGIRIVSDIMLYSLAYADKIDWQMVTERSKDIHAYDFVSALYKIGEHDLFPERFPDSLKHIWQTDEAEETSLLEDILSGGLYGTSSKERLHSANLTLHAAEEDATGIRSSALLRALFPAFSGMRSRYPYLQKYPFLLPFAWLQRMFRYGKENLMHARSGKQISEAVRIGNERIALMRQYRILEEKKEKDGLLKRLYRKSHTSFLAPVLRPVFAFISMLEFYALNLFYWLKGDRMPSKEDRKLVSENVTFIVKSFERQHLVKGLCRNLTRMYPGTAIIVADDSAKPLQIDLPEVRILQLPFNSGLGAGLSAALAEVKTPYLMRLDDDELLSIHSLVHRELRYLMQHTELDLIGFGHTTAIRLHSPEFNLKEYCKSSMKDALKPLKVPHLTKIDENHIVLGKVANIYLARTEKMREVGFDPKIHVIDHHEFFWRAAGVMTCAIAKDTLVFHRHNPYERKYRTYRSAFTKDLEYIREKRKRLIEETRRSNEK